MSEWEEENIRSLIHALVENGILDASDAEAALALVDEERYKEALQIAVEEH